MSPLFNIKTMWRSVLCALVATVTLSVCVRAKYKSPQADTLLDQAMNPFRTGKLVLFQVTYGRDWHFFEIMFFVILGIFGVLPQVPFLTHNSETEQTLRDYMVPL